MLEGHSLLELCKVVHATNTETGLELESQNQATEDQPDLVVEPNTMFAPNTVTIVVYPKGTVFHPHRDCTFSNPTKDHPRGINKDKSNSQQVDTIVSSIPLGKRELVFTLMKEGKRKVLVDGKPIVYKEVLDAGDLFQLLSEDERPKIRPEICKEPTYWMHEVKKLEEMSASIVMRVCTNPLEVDFNTGAIVLTEEEERAKTEDKKKAQSYKQLHDWLESDQRGQFESTLKSGWERLQKPLS